MKVESLPITTAAFKGLKVSHNTLDGIRLGFKSLRIYISAHFVSTRFKILLVFVDKHGHGKRGVHKTKIKGDSKKDSNFGGKTSMHKSTSILDFSILTESSHNSLFSPISVQI